MSLTWLHVSDFHLRAGDDYDRDVVLRALVAAVADQVHDGRPADLIVATGDVARSGKAAEYAAATRFFDALLSAAGLGRDRLIVVPGNHDVDRPLGTGLARTLGSREEADAYFDPDLPKPHIAQKLGAFAGWYDEYFKGIRTFPRSSTCYPVELFELGGVRLAVLAINSALFCQDGADHAKLLVGRRCLDAALGELGAGDADLRMALMHHPLDWLSDIERSNVKSSLGRAVDVFLTGHLHDMGAETVASTTGTTLFLAAGAAYQTREWPNRAMYVRFDGDSLDVLPIRYEDSPTEIWTVDPSIFPAEAGFQGSFPSPRLNTDSRARLPRLAAAPNPARHPTNITSLGNTPFVGRDTHLAAISSHLTDLGREQVVLVHGQPGVGKSELAREYGRRNRHSYPGGTFFVNCGNGDEMVDLAQVGTNLLGLEFGPGVPIRDQAVRALASLGGEPVLVIYDNATRSAPIDAWLPPSGVRCHVIVTAVDERLLADWPEVHVEPLTAETALDLISQLAGADPASQHGPALAETAGGLPVQIVPASRALAYESRRGRPPRPAALSGEARGSFAAVYETLEEPARLVLHTAAFLSARGAERSEIARPLADAKSWDQPAFERALDASLDLHLLEGDDVVRMHQLLAKFVASVRPEDDLAADIAMVRSAQLDRFVDLGRQVAGSPADSELAARFLVYPLELERWVDAMVDISVTEGEVVGRAMHELGRNDEARPWFERAVAAAEQGDVHGRIDHASLGRSLYQLGICLSRVGRYDEARPWYERAVAAAEQGDVHGRVDHAILGTSLRALVRTLHALGRDDEAKTWEERADGIE
ncbi:MAG: tetratricopeptide repeat protein [Solirubrobacterales bacterium]